MFLVCLLIVNCGYGIVDRINTLLYVCVTKAKNITKFCKIKPNHSYNKRIGNLYKHSTPINWNPCMNAHKYIHLLLACPQVTLPVDLHYTSSGHCRA